MSLSAQPFDFFDKLLRPLAARPLSDQKPVTIPRLIRDSDTLHRAQRFLYVAAIRRREEVPAIRDLVFEPGQCQFLSGDFSSTTRTAC